MIQLNEFASQINQYNSVLHWNWMQESADMTSFIENTLRLINSRETISPLFHLGDDDCQQCNRKNENFIFKVDIEQNCEQV